MAIELITGLPGASKTLYTLSTIDARAKAEGRDVYYHGIPELTLDWIHLEDPTKWFLVPPNSIVVIDEAQKIYRNRSIRSEPPLHVTELETHRHLGIDLVFLTQHPSLIDPAVRKLTQTHRHIVRLWGMEASTVHTWNAVKDNCDKSRADSQKTKWVFDKSMYGKYKSAEVHTMKRSIPGRVWFLLAAVVFLIFAGWYVNRLINKSPLSAQSAAAPLAAASVPQDGDRRQFDPVADAKQYSAMATPRVVGLQHTAPKYDEITKPTRAPVPAMCIKRGSRCQCYSQQATKLSVEFNQCVDIAYNGYFSEFDANGRDSSNKAAGGPVQPSGVPVADDRRVADARVVVIPYTPEPSKLSGPVKR